LDKLPLEFTFVLIKPDALERGMMGRIFTRIERTHLRISGIQERFKSKEWVSLHYHHLTDKEFFPKLVEFMTARSVVGFVVGGPYAIKRMCAIVGTTRPHEAAPGTIRGDWGNYPTMFNLIHVSDSQESAQREMELFFDHRTDVLDPVTVELDKDASTTMPS
jgi:nucleoside-diphosphate kinase